MKQDQGAPARERAGMPTSTTAADLHCGRRTLAIPAKPVFDGQDVAGLNLSRRTMNALHRAGIRRLADLAQWTARDLRTLPQLGPASLSDIHHALACCGLALRAPDACDRERH